MKKERNESIVGLFVITGLIVLTVMIFFISGVYLFRSGFTVNVRYDYVSILDKGAPVRMAGVRVGEVNQVSLIHDPETDATRVEVMLFIQKGVKLRENYLFRIQGVHILSEPHIEITPLPGDAEWLGEGAVIEGVDPVPVESLIEHADEISDELKTILSVVREAVEDEETAQSLKQIVVEWAALSRSLNEVLSGSEGELKEAFSGLNASTHSLSVILERMEKGEGTAGKLLSDDALYEEMRAFVADIKTHPWKLFKKG